MVGRPAQVRAPDVEKRGLYFLYAATLLELPMNTGRKPHRTPAAIGAIRER
jgi:hypothetical protein